MAEELKSLYEEQTIEATPAASGVDGRQGGRQSQGQGQQQGQGQGEGDGQGEGQSEGQEQGQGEGGQGEGQQGEGGQGGQGEGQGGGQGEGGQGGGQGEGGQGEGQSEGQGQGQGEGGQGEGGQGEGGQGEGGQGEEDDDDEQQDNGESKKVLSLNFWKENLQHLDEDKKVLSFILGESFLAAYNELDEASYYSGKEFAYYFKKHSESEMKQLQKLDYMLLKSLILKIKVNPNYFKEDWYCYFLFDYLKHYFEQMMQDSSASLVIGATDDFYLVRIGINQIAFFTVYMIEPERRTPSHFEIAILEDNKILLSKELAINILRNLSNPEAYFMAGATAITFSYDFMKKYCELMLAKN